MDNRGKLKSLFFDILNGHSAIKYRGVPIFLKHFTHFDSALVEERQEEISERAQKEGLPTEKERLEILEKEGFWTKENEIAIRDTKLYLEGMENTRKLLFKENDLKHIAAKIKEAQDKIKELQTQKAELVGLTCETFAAKKLNEYYIYISLYKNKDFSIPAFSLDEFDDFSYKELADLIGLYNKKTEEFNDKNLKKIAIAPFFLGIFNLSEQNAYHFFGKPLIYLTYFQTELFSLGRYFKGLLSQAQTTPPSDVMEDPDKLIEWCDGSKRANEILDKGQEGGAQSIVGMSAAKMKELGLNQGGEIINLAAEAKKKGGTLNMDDFIAIHKRAQGN